MKLISTIALALLATPVAAQEGTLWRNVTADMTRADLMALYPSAEVDREFYIKVGEVVTTGSRMVAWVTIDKATDRVVNVTLRGKYIDAAPALKNDLTLKYGKPDNEDCTTSPAQNCFATWKHGGTLITMSATYYKHTDYESLQVIYEPLAVNDNL